LQHAAAALDAAPVGSANDVDQSAQTHVRVVESAADSSVELQATRVARVDADGEVASLASTPPQRAGNDASLGPRTVRAEVVPAMSLGPAPVPAAALVRWQSAPVQPLDADSSAQHEPDSLLGPIQELAGDEPPTQSWRREHGAGPPAEVQRAVAVTPEGDFDSVDLPGEPAAPRAEEGSREDDCDDDAPVVDLAAHALGFSAPAQDEDATTGRLTRVGARADAPAPNGAAASPSVEPGARPDQNLAAIDDGHSHDEPDDLPVDFDYAHAVAATLNASLNAGTEVATEGLEPMASAPDLSAATPAHSAQAEGLNAADSFDADDSQDADPDEAGGEVDDVDSMPAAAAPAESAVPRIWPTGGPPLRARVVRDIDSADFSDLAVDIDLMGHPDRAPISGRSEPPAGNGSLPDRSASGVRAGDGFGRFGLADDNHADDDEATREINLRNRPGPVGEAGGSSLGISPSTLGIPRPVGRSRAPAESPAPRAVWDPRGSVRGDTNGKGRVGLPARSITGAARTAEASVEAVHDAQAEGAEVVRLAEAPMVLNNLATGGPDEITADRDDLAPAESHGLASSVPESPVATFNAAGHGGVEQDGPAADGLDVDLSGSDGSDAPPDLASEQSGLDLRLPAEVEPQAVHDFGRIVAATAEVVGGEGGEGESAAVAHAATGDIDPAAGRLRDDASETSAPVPRSLMDRGTLDLSPMGHLDDTTGLGPEVDLGEAPGRPVEASAADPGEGVDRPVGRAHGGVLNRRDSGALGEGPAPGSERRRSPVLATAEQERVDVSAGIETDDSHDDVDEGQRGEAETQALAVVSVPPALDEPLHALLRSLGADDASSLDDDEDDESTTMVTDLHNAIPAGGGVDRRSFSEILRSISGVQLERLGPGDAVPGRGRLDHADDDDDDGSEAGQGDGAGNADEPPETPVRDAHGRVGRHTVVHADSDDD
jgi:hypothetical protein